MTTPDITNHDLLALTTDIVAAHISSNQLPVAELPTLIKQVYGTLCEVAGLPPLTGNRPEPAVPVKKSITDDHIICLEDGKPLKMLKRYLKKNFNMTPEQYRERWNLPADYPMVAPNYTKRRSKLAMDIGLGRKNKIDVLKVAA